MSTLFDEISKEAVEEAFDEGCSVGYAEGYETGFDVGYEEGHEEGHAEGYNEGFSEGARGALNSVLNPPVETNTDPGDECDCNSCLSYDLDVVHVVLAELEQRIEAIELMIGVKYVD